MRDIRPTGSKPVVWPVFTRQIRQPAAPPTPLTINELTRRLKTVWDTGQIISEQKLVIRTALSLPVKLMLPVAGGIGRGFLNMLGKNEKVARLWLNEFDHQAGFWQTEILNTIGQHHFPLAMQALRQSQLTLDRRQEIVNGLSGKLREQFESAIKQDNLRQMDGPRLIELLRSGERLAPWKVAGLPAEAPTRQVKKRIDELLLAFHPDQNQGVPEAGDIARLLFAARDLVPGAKG